MTDEESFLSVADLLPEPMMLVSSDGTIRAANRACEERLGTAPGPFPGRRLQELVSDPPETIASYLRDCSRSRQFLLGSLHLLGTAPSAIWGAEGEVYRPREGGNPALLLLRLQPRESLIQ